MYDAILTTHMSIESIEDLGQSVAVFTAHLGRLVRDTNDFRDVAVRLYEQGAVFSPDESPILSWMREMMPALYACASYNDNSGGNKPSIDFRLERRIDDSFELAVQLPTLIADVENPDYLHIVKPFELIIDPEGDVDWLESNDANRPTRKAA